MARQSIINDRPAHIAWEYLHGHFQQEVNETIDNIVHIAVPDKNKAIRMLLDIAYRIGYGKSELAYCMSEVTYKKKKKWIRDTLVSELS
jgi:hypothetical protein